LSSMRSKNTPPYLVLINALVLIDQLVLLEPLAVLIN
jgi:hypothetical protein